jgi:hypothetical protein
LTDTSWITRPCPARAGAAAFRDVRFRRALCRRRGEFLARSGLSPRPRPIRG